MLKLFFRGGILLAFLGTGGIQVPSCFIAAPGRLSKGNATDHSIVRKLAETVIEEFTTPDGRRKVIENIPDSQLWESMNRIFTVMLGDKTAVEAVSGRIESKGASAGIQEIRTLVVQLGIKLGPITFENRGFPISEEHT